MDAPERIDRLALLEPLESGLWFIGDKTRKASDNGDIKTLVWLGNDQYLDTGRRTQRSITGLQELVNVGDLVFVAADGRSLRTYLSAKAKQNTILLTEECNNACLFCSQPPRPNGEFFDVAQSALSEFSAPCTIGLSGGEPTLHWEKFIELCKEFSKYKIFSFHILTHGRTFSDAGKAREFYDTGAPNFSVLGIPVHGHEERSHDLLSGAEGSFKETMNGLINLAMIGVAIEVRVVINAYNIKLLENIAIRIRSLLKGSPIFVALMQMEPVGWARTNFDRLQVAPEYAAEHLSAAAAVFETAGIPFGLYNYPLCQVPENLRGACHQSISDWKKYFASTCRSCSVRSRCCGFFSSSVDKRLFKPIAIYEA